MLQHLFDHATERSLDAAGRAEGAAYLKATASLYGLLALDYVSLNLPIMHKGELVFRHNAHGIGEIRQKVSSTRTPTEMLGQCGLVSEEVVDWHACDALSGMIEEMAAEYRTPANALDVFTATIATNHGETAIFGIARDKDETSSEQFRTFVGRDLRILMSYYHSHMLRLCGVSVEAEMIVSARELDCLKWTAAGKTAWEASRILGISERTVRFHLNSAREKLNCANTTQAVAKAVAENLISV